LLEKTHTMKGVLEDADRVEVEELARELYGAMETSDFDRVGELSDELADVLFYLE
jgi:NTP pyrophosphatase (non-canonical NTP hydrolase)